MSPQDPPRHIPETKTENKIIGDILPLLNKNGLTSHQSLNLLEQLGVRDLRRGLRDRFDK